ncbi:PREDICTED: class II histocompatibility antigen, B-L beta chain-like [Tinamus guttatus]|uniref:class II histocompatibility antigen, B-L beta chain-like n=1 Tax=Tinamus guttatus TaxID=94827 RepID=UPI00052E8932|nr:PREDICTED: class II histocompatibility antigen, B-L beta chain-like [Tinamus guttatus]
MGTVRAQGDRRCWAGAVLVALVALGAHGARGQETTGYFQEIRRSECHYLNGSQRVKLLERYLYNGRPFLHFDSDVGRYAADSPLGEPDAEYLNGQVELLQKRRAEVDAVCRHNARVWGPYTTRRRVQPEVEIYPVQSGSLPQTDRLVCAVMDFYPPEIEVKWFKNGREETERVVATEVMRTAAWPYEVFLALGPVPLLRLHKMKHRDPNAAPQHRDLNPRVLNSAPQVLRPQPWPWVLFGEVWAPPDALRGITRSVLEGQEMGPGSRKDHGALPSCPQRGSNSPKAKAQSPSCPLRASG